MRIVANAAPTPSAAPATPQPADQSRPSALSTDADPGPVSAIDAPTVARTTGYSQPLFVTHGPRPRSADAAFSMTPTIAAPALPDLAPRLSVLPAWQAACAPSGQSVRTSSLVGRRSDLEGAARSELPPVVLVVLGWVVVNVGHGHGVLEVGIPARREVHRESESALGLPGEAAA
jgi:hypothetical protein